MSLKKINRASDGALLEIYDATNRGETDTDWNWTHCAPEAIHTKIPDQPSKNYIWDDAASKWEIDIEQVKEQKRTELNAQAREDEFRASPKGIALTAAEEAIDAATSVTATNKITL